MSKTHREDLAFTRMVIVVPERPLSESIFDLAAPLLERLDPPREPGATRRVLQLAIEVWNLHVMAAPVWRKPEGLAAARARLLRPRTPPATRSAFELLAERRVAKFRDDPRRVGMWSFEPSASTPGNYDLLCESLLPRGTEAQVAPATALRVGIGGRWLDEIAMRLTDTSYALFPVSRHRARVDEQGVVLVHTRACTVVQIFAIGLLPPVGGAPVELTVQGRTVAKMVLAEVRGSPQLGDDEIVLRFEPAAIERITGPRG